MVGAVLVIESLHIHIPKGYIYVAMAFSVGVEILTLRMRANMESRGITTPNHTDGTPAS